MPVPTAASNARLPRPDSDGKGRGLSRRNLLAGLGASGVVAAYALTRPSAPAVAPAKAAAQGRALATGEIDRWRQLVGTEFRAAGLRLNFAGVRPLTSIGERPANVTRSRAFLVVFDVLGGQQMPGDLIYAMSAPGYGPLDIFLTSGATSEFPNRMHAVFN